MIERVPMLWRRVAFFAYAAALFVATHWPRLELNVRGVERPDLLAHLLVFGVWFLLLFFSGLPGSTGLYRSVGRAWLIAAGYAAADEALQLPEFVRRHAAWDDLAANLAGVSIGAMLACGWVSLRRSRRNGDRV